jgi:carboxyl-terminal processing protease
MKMNKPFRKAIIISLLVLFSGGFAAFQHNDFEIAKNLDIFYTLFREVNLFYVDEVDPGELIETGINGMLQSLDPYTNFIPESKIEDFRIMQTGQYGGIGALFREAGGVISVTEPYEGSPASKAGLKAGDVILRVDGRDIENRTLDELGEYFKGQPNTSVTLLIQRPGDSQPKELTIVREQIELKSVPHYQMLDHKTGYIQLNSFTDKAFTEVKEALTDLKEKQGATSVILDLRGNPGGLLIEAVKIVNLFIPRDMEVVSTKGKIKSQDRSYKTTMPAYDIEIPVVVLVNSKSASASEIVSGALQDVDRGVIIGTRTFGKGLVQAQRDLSYNTKMKITTAKYYIPSGRCIQALDYTHRNEDGSVGKIPDSLITQYSTRNGRKVYDGGGVMPDIPVKPENLSKLAQSLLAGGIIFDFVTQYCIGVDSIPGPAKFSLSENDYLRFKEYVKKVDFDYHTRSEEIFLALKETAGEEKYLEVATNEFAALEKILAHDLEKDIETFKDEIKYLLNQEILRRFYFRRGAIEFDLIHDEVVKKAVEVINDKSKYNSILAGTMVFKE